MNTAKENSARITWQGRLRQKYQIDWLAKFLSQHNALCTVKTLMPIIHVCSWVGKKGCVSNFICKFAKTDFEWFYYIMVPIEI